MDRADGDVLRRRRDGGVRAVGRAAEGAVRDGARQLAEEKEAVEQYGSSEAGASLGDILGAALKAKQ